MKHSPAPIETPLVKQPRPTPVELWIVAALFLIGTGLRCAYPSRMAIEHFDEGVYASNIWFGADDDFRYPAQHLFAPPLLPSLIETVLLLLGPSNVGAMLPGLIAGCLTIPLVWWVAREWFGTTAGIASATLAALSDPHIVFSRTALTDVLLCFWLLLAVYFTWRALSDGGRWSTIAAGIFTALAWWTKYNGWLPLAIGGAGLVPWCVLPRLRIRPRIADFGFPIAESIKASESPNRANREPRKPVSTANEVHLVASALRWLAIASIAFAAWSPWLWSLQSKGGYAAVAANHRGYLVGLGGWISTCLTQCGNLKLLEGTAGQHAPVAALLIAAIWVTLGTPRFTWNMFAGSFASWLAIGLLAALLGGWGLTACIGAAGLFAAILLADGIEHPAERQRVRLAVWMLAAWFVGLTLTTPLYTPYPRLTLPWVMAGWLAGGLGVYLFVSFLGQVAHGKRASATDVFRRFAWKGSKAPLPRSVILFGSLGLGLSGMFVLEAYSFRQGFPGWESRTAVRDESAKLLRACRSKAAGDRSEGDPVAIYTFAEPAALFQLYLAGATDVYPVASLDVARTTTPTPELKRFVVVGSQAVRTKGYDAQFEPLADRLSLVSGDCLNPSNVVWLDNRGWMPAVTDAPGDDESCRYRLSLYLIR